MARVSVISGGATGIGKAIATRLASDGDQVVLLGRRPEALEKAAAEITGAAT